MYKAESEAKHANKELETSEDFDILLETLNNLDNVCKGRGKKGEISQDKRIYRNCLAFNRIHLHTSIVLALGRSDIYTKIKCIIR